MNTDERFDLTDGGMARAAEAVSRLPRPEPPAGLAARTLARFAATRKPAKRLFWLLRPITHPLARIAAAACIIYTLAPMTDFNLAVPLGDEIQAHITGFHAAEKMEGLVDRVLAIMGPSNYSQADLEALMGTYPPRRSCRQPHYKCIGNPHV